MSGQGVKARSQAQSSRRVHQRIEHLQAVMAHADRVGVGKRQAQPAAHLPMVLDAPRSARRPDTGPASALRQDVADQIVFERLVEHGIDCWCAGGLGFTATHLRWVPDAEARKGRKFVSSTETAPNYSGFSERRHRPPGDRASVAGVSARIAEMSTTLPTGTELEFSDQAEGWFPLAQPSLRGTVVGIIPLPAMVGQPEAIAASGGDLFVAEYSSINEYTTSGKFEGTIVSRLNGVQGLAVSGNDMFVTQVNGLIGEYTTSGATVSASLISDSGGPVGVAVSGNDLYVTNVGSGTVGEYTLSGATVNASFITGLDGPYAIAVIATPEPATWLPLAIGAASLLAGRLRKRGLGA